MSLAQTTHSLMDSHQDAYLEEHVFSDELRELLRHALHNPDQTLQTQAIIESIYRVKVGSELLFKHPNLLIHVLKTFRQIVMSGSVDMAIKSNLLKALLTLSKDVFRTSTLSLYEYKEVLASLADILLYGPQGFQKQMTPFFADIWTRPMPLAETQTELLMLTKKLLISDRLQTACKQEVLNALLSFAYDNAFSSKTLLDTYCRIILDLCRYFIMDIEIVLYLLEVILHLGHKYHSELQLKAFLMPELQKLSKRSPYQREDRVLGMCLHYMMYVGSFESNQVKTILHRLISVYYELDFTMDTYQPMSPDKSMVHALGATIASSKSFEERMLAMQELAKKRFGFPNQVEAMLHNITCLDPRNFMDAQLFAGYLLKGYHKGTDTEFTIIVRLLEGL
ncbi:hypothetical protein DID77_01745 [Candidatus Marinamargulisbacteria bacterium SCGC AG-439-L15]|nr:hypothetical protein DID77_01745 [Candidatus Marinamargulisbacteria bacterium SCGC AG-439-L15]